MGFLKACAVVQKICKWHDASSKRLLPCNSEDSFPTNYPQFHREIGATKPQTTALAKLLFLQKKKLISHMLSSPLISITLEMPRSHLQNPFDDRIKLRDISSILASPDFVKHQPRPGLVFPVKTVLSFITPLL